MIPREIIVRAKETLQAVMNMEFSSVTGVSKTEDGWRVVIELVERKAIPDAQDLLGVYEVHLDEDGQMTGFERRKIRRRIDLEETVE